MVTLASNLKKSRSTQINQAVKLLEFIPAFQLYLNLPTKIFFGLARAVSVLANLLAWQVNWLVNKLGRIYIYPKFKKYNYRYYYKIVKFIIYKIINLLLEKKLECLKKLIDI